MTRVVLAQLPVPAVGPRECTGLAPLGVASLVLHAAAGSARAVEGLRLVPAPVLRRAGDELLARAILAEAPDVLALTVDVWNVERSLALVRRLRRERPRLAVWLGGPEVAADAPLLAAHDAGIDVIVEGEGERVFAALLGGALPRSLPGAVDHGRGVFVPAGALGSLPDLRSLHDPYVAGLLEPEPDGVMLAELWRGCVHHCTFCRYHAGRHAGPAARPADLLDGLFGWAREHGVRELYLLDPSLEQRPDLADLLSSLASANRSDLPLFVELRAEAIEPDLAARLRRAGVRGAEVGLQSTNPEALRLVARSFDARAFERGARALVAAGVRVRLDLMLGLPGDTEEGLRRTLAFVGEQGLTADLQLFRTKVLPGTALRRTAGRLGIVHQAEPPYGVLATPTWPAERLDAALDVASEVLDRELRALEPPVIERPAWGRRTAAIVDWPDADAALTYAYRLDAREGRSALAAEGFERAGNVVALWLEADDPTPWREALRAALRRLLEVTPFSTVTVALAVLPEIPLDTFVTLDEALQDGRPSRYLEHLHETPRPERRLAAVLELPWAARIDAGWLAALRPLATVLWMTRPDTPEAAIPALQAVEGLDPRDALLVVPRTWPTDRDALDRALAPLAETCPAPERVIWSPLPIAWSWERVALR